MAKDKKSAKSEGKKAKAAEKKQKQEKKADKKGKQKTARQQQQGDDDDDVDLDQVLEAYRREQEQFLKITETVSATGPPRARSAAAFLASPANANQLLLFGGEYYNGALATFFNDLHVYYIDRDEWRTVTSPNAPLPRSGHAWCRGGHQSGAVFLFGGEFSSPKQGTFYHYNDFWRLDPAARAWTRIEGGSGGTKGGGGGNNATPPARSGHRMTYFKQYIVLFGGFQDTAHQTRYLADLWLYDTTSFRWFSPAPATAIRPDARSSFTLLPHEQGAVLYGGYSRVKASATRQGGGGSGGKQGGGGGGKGANNAKAGALQAVVHQDCFLLKITPPAADAPPGTAPTVRWEQRRKPANAPSPPRAGATMAYHRGRGILFGGVHDVAESDEGLESEFFNTLWAWNIERNRFFPLALRKRRQQQPSAGAGDERRAAGGGGGGRRNRAAADEEALLKQLAALEAAAAGKKTGDAAGGGTGDGEDGGDSGSDSENGDTADTADKTDKADESRLAAARNKPVSMEMPHVRFNTLLAVQGDVLYLYGGTFEKDDREFTFDDMYAVDLGKMDGCKEIFSRPLDEWIDSESEDDEDEDDDDDDDDEEEEDGDKADEKVEEPKASEAESKKHTPSKRKDKRGGGPVAAAAAAAEAEAAPPPQAPADEEADADADAAAADDDKDDGLPHPRPFESRRDFFHRTSGAWQEVLLARLRAAGGSGSSSTEEALSVKALKTKAFEMSEAKWWDCREEITALEDAQDAAGIGEVVSLADRGGGGGKRGGGDGSGGGGGGGGSGPRRR